MSGGYAIFNSRSVKCQKKKKVYPGKRNDDFSGNCAMQRSRISNRDKGYHFYFIFQPCVASSSITKPSKSFYFRRKLLAAAPRQRSTWSASRNRLSTTGFARLNARTSRNSVAQDKARNKSVRATLTRTGGSPWLLYVATHLLANRLARWFARVEYGPRHESNFTRYGIC